MRLVVAVAAVAVATAVSAGLAEAAAPRIVIVSGHPLTRQVVISNWTAIFHVVEAVNSSPTVERAQLADRPHLKISMFWGPRWNDYLRSGHRAATLRPRDADQFGTFYPASHGSPAAIELPWAGKWPRLIPGKALRTLERYGGPIGLR